MNKVYLVESRDFDGYLFVKKAFSNRTKAQAYIDGKLSWKKQLKEETGLDYDEWYNKEWLLKHDAMSDKMYNWLFDHSIEDDREFFINALDVE